MELLDSYNHRLRKGNSRSHGKNDFIRRYVSGLLKKIEGRICRREAGNMPSFELRSGNFLYFRFLSAKQPG